MIYRGTTPTIVLHLKDETINTDELSGMTLTLVNDSGRNKLIKDNCIADNVEKTISVQLTYDDTMQFEEGYLLCQLDAILNEQALKSPVVRTVVGPNLKER